MKHTGRKKKYLEQTLRNSNFFYQTFHIVPATCLLYIMKFGNYLQNSRCDLLKVQGVLITGCLLYTRQVRVGRENSGYVDIRFL